MVPGVQETFSFRPKIVLQTTPLCSRQGPLFMREKVILIKVWQEFLSQYSINFFTDSLHAIIKNQSINRLIWRVFSNLHDYHLDVTQKYIVIGVNTQLMYSVSVKECPNKNAVKKYIFVKCWKKQKTPCESTEETSFIFWAEWLHLKDLSTESKANTWHLHDFLTNPRG